VGPDPALTGASYKLPVARTTTSAGRDIYLKDPEGVPGVEGVDKSLERVFKRLFYFYR